MIIQRYSAEYRWKHSGIPKYLTEDQVRKIASPFGELVSCSLQVDPATKASKVNSTKQNNLLPLFLYWSQNEPN